MNSSRPPVVIIGIGSTMRGDDGIGPAAVACIERAETLPVDGSTELLTLDGEPTRLIEAWRDRQLAIVIDAVRTGDAPGAVHRVAVGDDPLPSWTPGASSHSAGLAEAVALGRVLDRLPDQMVVFGMEPADLSHRPDLSAVATGALPGLVALVVAEASQQ
jgi:hydrogenase maturation protease